MTRFVCVVVTLLFLPTILELEMFRVHVALVDCFFSLHSSLEQISLHFLICGIVSHHVFQRELFNYCLILSTVTLGAILLSKFRDVKEVWGRA